MGLFYAQVAEGGTWFQLVVTFTPSGREKTLENKSLCGQYPCQHLCSRVQHCPAGMERVHWLWLCRQVEKGESKARTATRRQAEPGLNLLTGEVSEPRPYLERARHSAVQFIDYIAPRAPKRQRGIYGSRNLKFWTTSAILTGLLVFMGLVIGLGLAQNYPNVIPFYRAEDVFTWDAR